MNINFRAFYYLMQFFSNELSINKYKYFYNKIYSRFDSKNNVKSKINDLGQKYILLSI